MANLGRLNKTNMGYSMPVDAPLYPKPPVHYRDATFLTIACETDEEAVLDVLPEDLVVSSPAVAVITIVNYPISTLGAYDEAVLSVSCLWQNQPFSYVAHIVVNTEPPLAAGREIWGVPKKLADITLRAEHGFYVGTVERPRGNRLCTAMFRPERAVAIDGSARENPLLTLRVIPSPEESREPSLVELISTQMVMTPHHLWRGTGSLSFDTRSEFDPWYRFPSKRIISANYGVFDVVLPYGKILRRY